MRIVIKDAGNNQTVLCDGPARGLDLLVGPLVPGVSCSSATSVQAAPRFRAATTLFFDRLNRSVALQFSVSREMASLQAAESWQLAFLASVIRAGTVYFFESDAGGNQLQWRLLNAVIAEIGFTPMGVTREVRYTINGGSLTL